MAAYRGKVWTRRIKLAGTYLALLAVGLLMAAPFVWMLLTSLKTLGETEHTTWVPAAFQWDNYPQVFREIAFAKYYFNSLFVAAWVTFLQVMTSAMAAFAFSRLHWRGRDKVFLLYMTTMMIPGLVTMIPNFAVMVKLHLFNSYLCLVLPAAFSAFGTFMLRQFMLTIPPSLDEAAEIDGAGKWQVFWEVIMPMAKPGLLTLAIFVFLGNYGSFFWPLVTIKDDALRTLPIGMLYFQSDRQQAIHLLMAASVMNVIPVIILFVTLQKFLVRGIQLGAVKG